MENLLARVAPFFVLDPAGGGSRSRGRESVNLRTAKRKGFFLDKDRGRG
jgi:hypothetical protein